MYLSVIMPVYNESIRELNDSITSILNQSYTDFELIIIDDNPKLNNIKIFLKKKSLYDSRIKLLFNSKSIGPALSRNKGILHSNSKLIAIMDADDISVRDRLLSQIKFMHKYRLDFVFSNCINFNNKGMYKENVSCKSKILNQNIIKYIFSHYYDCAIHSGWMLRRSIYLKLNGYRNLLHGEDYDFIIRALTYGYKIGFQPKNVIYKRIRINGVSNSNQLKQFNISLILKKYTRQYKYTRIIPLNYIYKCQNNFSKKDIIKFNKFLRLGHITKHSFNLKTFIEFLCLICISLNATKYLFELLSNKIYKSKIHKMIIK